MRLEAMGKRVPKREVTCFLLCSRAEEMWKSGGKRKVSFRSQLGALHRLQALLTKMIKMAPILSPRLVVGLPAQGSSSTSTSDILREGREKWEAKGVGRRSRRGREVAEECDAGAREVKVSVFLFTLLPALRRIFTH